MSRKLMVLGAGLLWAGTATANVPSFASQGVSGDSEGGDEERSGPTAPSDAPPTANIVAGEVVVGDAFPEVVGLEISGVETSGESTCTGSLIHPNWVLTAAHCIDSTSDDGVTVVFGNNTSTDRRDAIQSDKVVAHPNWQSTEEAERTGDFDFDVALVHLSEPKEDLLPMPLNVAEVNNDWLNTDVTFIGFGITEYEGTGTGTKRFVEVPITRVDEQQIITHDGVHSTCQGDSGGPGVVYGPDGYTQAGITSYGRGCGDGPSGAMRVDANLSFLTITMGEDKFTTKASTPPSYRCSHEQEPGSDTTIAISNVPFDMKCRVDYRTPDQISKVEWNWGDGTDEILEGDDKLTATHTYERSGNYNVEMCASGVREGTEWSHCVNRVAYVRACDVPQAAFSWEGVRGRTFQLVNRTDLSVYGCVFNVQWDIFEGDTATGEPIDTVAAWAPQYTFPDPGTYTVVLNVGGLAGTGAAEATFAVKAGNNASTGGACSQVGGAGAGALLLSLGLLGIRRRQS